jgi:phage repressor protein C with HTH and peptisase S24 domain
MLVQNRPAMELGKEIRARRKAVGWKRQDALAKAAGVATETVHRVENDLNVHTDKLDAIIRALVKREGEKGIARRATDQSRHTGTGQPVIAEDEAEEFDRDISRGYKKHDVPVIGDAEASTNGFIAWDGEGLVRAEITEWVSRSFADGDPRAYALRVRGDSMVPRYFPGEVIVTQPREICRDGDYAVAILKSGERLVKRVFRHADGWLLHSENPLYPDRQVADDDVLMLHRIRHSIAAR